MYTSLNRGISELTDFIHRVAKWETRDHADVRTIPYEDGVIVRPTGSARGLYFLAYSSRLIKVGMVDSTGRVEQWHGEIITDGSVVPGSTHDSIAHHISEVLTSV